MRINEFIKEIYLHDSLIENIELNGLNLIFDIELCWWMQKHYKPNDDEIKKIKLTFYNVTCFKFNGEKEIDSDTILDFSIIEHDANSKCSYVKIVFGDSNDIKIVSFRSDNVNINWQ